MRPPEACAQGSADALSPRAKKADWHARVAEPALSVMRPDDHDHASRLQWVTGVGWGGDKPYVRLALLAQVTASEGALK